MNKNKYAPIESLCDNLRDYASVDPSLYEKFHVKRGLRKSDGTGVVAGITKICNVHGYLLNEGEVEPIPGELIYRGYNINDLVANVEREGRFGYEEVAYLLLFGSLPSAAELKQFRDHIANSRELPDDFAVDMILKAPSKNIMNKMGRSILALYSYDDDGEDMSLESEMNKAVGLIAKLPVIMTHAYQVKQRHYNNQSLIIHQLRPEESTAETILSMLRPDRQYTPEEAHILDVALMLHAEHGGGNNSTFSCRVLTSSGTDAYSAYSAAIGSLKGAKHGGANIKVEQMISDFKANIEDWSSEDQVADYIRKTMLKQTNDRSGLVYGMGHAVYTLSDPRAVILKRKAFELAKDTEFEEEFRLLENIEKLTPEVFKQIKGEGKTMCANVDLYSGLVYRMLRIPQDLYTPLFAVARMAGWAAHRMEEMMTGGRIIRPAYKAVAKQRDYTSINDR